MDDRLSHIPIPNFEGALSPINEFLNKVSRQVPGFRLLVILDEFDELPMELYKRGSVGDAFFLTIRAISGKPLFGFILVGSEKMEWILSCQGDALNKFQAVRVDYFDRMRHWADFQELVRKPVKNWLEISDEALVTLYDLTAGNPYFTKLICRALVKIMLSRRDSHVTPIEVEDAKRVSLKGTASNSFQHFWEDGISATGEKAEEVSVLRRKVLMAIGDALRTSNSLEVTAIRDSAAKYGLQSEVVDAELREFERRHVLVNQEGIYTCKVPFFQEWLHDCGVKEIITSFVDPDSILLLRKSEEDAYVTPEEIVSVVQRLGPYKGRAVTEDRVRSWLRQFGDNISQRLMWKLLRGLTFYSGALVRAKIREADGIVNRAVIWQINESRLKRSDILVSYLGSPGKSGTSYAKLYADENNIYYKNVVEVGKIREEIESRPEIKALVFVDDFVGTGRTVAGQLVTFLEDHRDQQRLKEMVVSFVAICGFQTAQAKICDAISTMMPKVHIHICDPLDESAKCFGPSSDIFPDRIEREQARDVAARCGALAVKTNVLGYGGCETAIVFENSCPNNSLPILWAQSKEWSPLFPRL